MNILDELNKKVSLYQSPKLNWLTKRDWLFNTVHIAAVATMFLGGTVWMDSLTSSPSSMEIVLTLVFIFFGAPLYVIGLSTLFFKYKYPLQEKVVEEYTESILKSFSESQYHEIKIKLLKILNDEPYTPVSFFDDILQCKHRFDKQQNDKEFVKSVKEPVSLTVLIEKMEQQKNKSLSEKEDAYQKRIESISKLSNDERTNLVEFQDAIDAFLTKFQTETKNSSQKILVGLSDIVEKFNLDNRFELVFDNKFIVSITKELKVEFQTDKQLASSKKTVTKPF